MQGDLISRSALEAWVRLNYSPHQSIAIIDLEQRLKTMPTAYDVEAVVAAIKTKHCKKCRNILGIAGAEEYCKEQKCEIEGVCKIVRNGGKE